MPLVKMGLTTCARYSQCHLAWRRHMDDSPLTAEFRMGLRPAQLRRRRSAPRPDVRAAQQREQAAARHGPGKVKSRDRDRERQANAQSQERYGDELQVLERENDGDGGEQNNERQIDNAHESPPVAKRRTSSHPTITAARSCGRRLCAKPRSGGGAPPQTQPQADPAGAGKAEVDAAEQAEGIEARDG